MTQPEERSPRRSGGVVPVGRPEEVTGRRPPASDDEPPPVLGSWPRLYALVIGFLALTIVLLGWLTASFR